MLNRYERRQFSRRRSSGKQISRRVVLIISGTVLLLLLVGIIALLLVPDKNDISYRDAQINHSLRVAYVQQLGERAGVEDYVEIVYVPDQKIVSNGVVLPARVISGLDASICFGQSNEASLVRIQFFSAAFNLETEGDIISLFRHEHHHAGQHRTRMVVGIPFSDFCTADKGLNVALLRNILELDATKAVDLPRLDELSLRLQQSIPERYSSDYKILWDTTVGMNPEMISRFKIEFFQPWMFDVFTKRDDDSYVWKPTPNEEYVFSKEEIKRIKQNQD